jgi:hypothetical protein
MLGLCGRHGASVLVVALAFNLDLARATEHAEAHVVVPHRLAVDTLHFLMLNGHTLVSS